MKKIDKILYFLSELERNTKNVFFKQNLMVLMEYDKNIIFCIENGIFSPNSEIYRLFYILNFIIEDGYNIDTFEIFEQPTEGIYVFLSYKKSKSFIISYKNQNNINIFASVNNNLIQCENISQAVILDNSFYFKKLFF